MAQAATQARHDRAPTISCVLAADGSLAAAPDSGWKSTTAMSGAYAKSPLKRNCNLLLRYAHVARNFVRIVRSSHIEHDAIQHKLNPINRRSTVVSARREA
ncbi:hypothetical protein RX327_31365 [Bradyrhizobium sp. BEA-2-5]|uniref:hypothetical protein n=1 Tax=Bradyrhizobium sp. BEA-2-5 TaxID=3080015 RepID=UPI00293E2380|nr:hypothetical protein [Bradyrhizobium sp. BEA-2-5]WOH80277.1 hypothetical protein RX327_31365 [Bradyrhizobium sp. BEA-2-5]